MKVILISLLFFSICGCLKLDEDGGYYDEKNKLYKYVDATRKGSKASQINLKTPVVGEIQQIQGIVSQIGDDAKSIWIQINSRQEYQIIAQSLSAGNRNDKAKQLKLNLSYVSPVGSMISGVQKRKRWKKAVLKVLEHQLLKKVILADISYEERAKNLRAVVYKIVQTPKGDKIRNINKWMILEGLSFYFIDKGKAPQHEIYNNAQQYARKHKKGLWGR